MLIHLEVVLICSNVGYYLLFLMLLTKKRFEQIYSFLWKEE